MLHRRPCSWLLSELNANIAHLQVIFGLSICERSSSGSGRRRGSGGRGRGCGAGAICRTDHHLSRAHYRPTTRGSKNRPEESVGFVTDGHKRFRRTLFYLCEFCACTQKAALGFENALEHLHATNQKMVDFEVNLAPFSTRRAETTPNDAKMSCNKQQCKCSQKCAEAEAKARQEDEAGTNPGIPVFELGPIRPPNEHTSLLLRVQRNCPWNRCKFCSSYKCDDKNAAFSLRPVEEIKRDIDGIFSIAQQLMSPSPSNACCSSTSPASMAGGTMNQHQVHCVSFSSRVACLRFD